MNSTDHLIHKMQRRYNVSVVLEGSPNLFGTCSDIDGSRQESIVLFGYKSSGSDVPVNRTIMRRAIIYYDVWEQQ